ncbi:MAG: histidine--tRNA ligase [Armatimonadota bacterium]
MITTPRGTHDVMPQDAYKWKFAVGAAYDTADIFNYKQIRFPVFEDTSLFTRSIGEATDIVEKEMYTFKDKAGRLLTLTPEGTASVARSYIQHNIQGMWKVFYIAPVFRYERPQSGRYRQHYQFGIEAIGSIDPALDVEVMSLAINFYKKLGLKNLFLSLNSIGCSVCRKKFKEYLIDTFKDKTESLCSECKERLYKNPMRLIDCKSAKCKEQVKDLNKLIDYLCEECSEHFSKVKSYLDKMSIPYKIDPLIVRGLDYYTKTVFEVISDSLGAHSTLCGGGRYDGLIKELGGKDTPAVGFGAGIERAILVMESAGVNIPAQDKPDVFIVVIGDGAFSKAVDVLYGLRSAGISADMDYEQKGVKSQFKQANNMNARYCLVIGEDEIKKGAYVLKDMGKSLQEEISADNTVNMLKSKIEV